MATLSVRLACQLVGSYTTADANFGATTKALRFPLDSYTPNFASGTSSGKADLLYTSAGNVTDSGTEFDLTTTSTVSDAFGSSISFASVTGIVVLNKSTISGEIITVGGGSAPFTAWMSGTTPACLVYPAASAKNPGILLIWSPQDGYTMGADNTNDEIKLTASSGDTIAYELCVIGRSA